MNHKTINDQYSESIKAFFINARNSGYLSITNIASCVYLIILALTVYDYYHLISKPILFIHVTAAAIIFGNLLASKKINNIKASAFIFISCVFVVHMANVNFAGGIETPHYAWILLIPILAGSTLNWKGQVFFFALTVLGTLYYYLNPALSITYINDQGAGYVLLTRLLSLLVCSLVMISYHLTLEDKIENLNIEAKKASFESNLFLGLFNSSTQNVLLIDKASMIIRANALAHKTFGFEDGTLLTKSVQDISKSDILIPSINSNEQNTLPKPSYKVTLLNGETIWLELNSVTLTEAADNSVTILILEDITQRKNQETQLSYLAHYDVLTKLPNRIVVQNRLAELTNNKQQYNGQFSVLFIDLNKFKYINDTAGHDVGDLVLIEVARRLQSSFRQSDMIARFGGDEFVVILNDLNDREQISKIIEKVQSNLNEPMLIDKQEYFISSSVGVAKYPSDGITASELLKKADIAMFHAKKLGGNSCEFYDSIQDTGMKRNMEISAELNYAIDRDELKLLFQPIVDNSGRIVGAEALLRWEHDSLGFISPEEFIPICEENGLIIPIGDWVLNEACSTLKKWQMMGIDDLFISVNVSYRQLYRTNLVDDIRNMLNIHGINGKSLILELTERVFADDIELVKKCIKQLKLLGVKTVIDDFGVDYSSLSYLKDTSFSAIKIDKSFIQEIANSSSEASLCHAISSMAKSLNLNVIAEGVETQAQLDVLRGFQVDRYQGYYFSKPLSLDSFEHAIQTDYPLTKLSA